MLTALFFIIRGGVVSESATTEFLAFQGIPYTLYIPGSGGRSPYPLKLLVSQHGTRKLADSPGPRRYLDIPRAKGDAERYGLAIVAPGVISREEAPNAPIHGTNFAAYDGPYAHWMHDLVHAELPERFAERNVEVDTDRFYLFGQSLGGTFVHFYVMRYGGQDIHAAASCAGNPQRRGNLNPPAMADAGYLALLDAYIQTPVALVVGNNDHACGDGEEVRGENYSGSLCVGQSADGTETTEDRWRRIKYPRKFICHDVQRRVSATDFRILTPPPPAGFPPGAAVWCDAFEPPERLLDRPSRPVPAAMRFLWAKGDHNGRTNYEAAREFLFGGLPRRSLTWEARLSVDRLLTSEYRAIRRRLSELDGIEQQLGDREA